jgi:hypothetical protein
MFRRDIDYDGDYAFKLYKRWLHNRESIDTLVEYMQRYVVLRLKKQGYHRRVSYEICAEIVQTTLIELWKTFRRKNLPTANPALWHGYLNTVVIRWFAKGFKDFFYKPQQNIDTYDHIERQIHRIPTASDVEDVIFLDELPVVLRKMILGTLRFPGEKTQGAVKYILDRIFNGEPIVDNWLKIHYDIDNPEFLVEHVRICLKLSLYEIRKDVNLRPTTNTEEILRETLSDYLSD